MNPTLADTLTKIKNAPIAVKVVKDANEMNWNPWLTLFAGLSVIAAIVIPFLF